MLIHLDGCATGRKRAPSVLIVDDVSNIALAMGEVFADEGFEATSTSDANDALKLLRTKRYDLLVTAVVMPMIRGFRLAKIARESQPWIKIIYMSGYNDEVFAAGRNRLGLMLMKPFRPKQLVAAAKRLLSEGD